MNSAANELASLVRALSSPEPAARERAAVAIFRAGCELSHPATQSWFLDPELASYVVRDRAGIPELTVGLAVKPETFEQIRAACGLPPLANVPPDQDAREFELEFLGAARLDVLTTAAPAGPGAIARFLQRSGEAIQQVEIGVTDVDRATAILRRRFGATPLYPATRPGADGTRVNFFLVHAAQDRKVLIELVEKSPRSERDSLK
ncbi:MAG: hypothetical protein KGL02_04165 [Acidobacteriota bacterium]|nr:hypothetical protein [Acidobacteriota bacterium]